MTTRDAVRDAERVVIKLGTRVLTREDGSLALSRLFGLIEQMAAMQRSGRQVILVSSGAVGLGVEALGVSPAASDLSLRQACAAVGQSRLMELYQQGFGRLGAKVAQILLTRSDFDHPSPRESLGRVLNELLERGAIPIVNENDVVSTEELEFRGPYGFGDNDQLSALLARQLGCDLLVLCTNVSGVYDRDPRSDASARLLEQVDDPSALEFGAPGKSGRGGMRSKVEAARLASEGGCDVLVIDGRTPELLARAVAGDAVGTWFPKASA